MLRALPLLLLGACAELPPLEGTISRTAMSESGPVLLPVDPILAEAARPSSARATEGPLAARGAALSRARITAPATDDLGARGRRLRERADRLRAAPL